MSTFPHRCLAPIFLTCLWLALSARPATAQPPLVDIGTLGGNYIALGGINASGQVAAGSRLTGDQYIHAALWTPDFPNATTGTWTDLGALDGTYSAAYAINDSGVVVGETNLSGMHPFVWIPDGPNATTGNMIDLGTLGGGSFSAAYAINATNQIVGRSMTSQGVVHAFLWTDAGGGTMVDLGTLGGVYSEARGISADGKVVGRSRTSDGKMHAFLWVPDSPNGTTGSMQDLGTLGGDMAEAWAINAAGQVTGSSTLADPSAPAHAFLWTPGASDGVSGNVQMRDLGTFGANVATLGSAINDNGVVAGTSSSPTGIRSLIWVPEVPNGTTGHLIDTGSLGGSQGVSLGINASNQITGYSTLTGDPTYFDPNSGGHPVILHAFVSGGAGSGKFAQQIAFGALGSKTFGDSDFAVSATASSGLAVTFDASGSCTVTDGTVHLTGTGTCTITASQAGNVFFEPAIPVPQSFDVNPASLQSQTIDFAPIANKLVGDADFQVSAIASSGLPVTFSASYDCTIIGADIVHLTGVGSCLVTASQAGDSTYQPAQRARSFFISTTPVTSTLVDIGTLGGGIMYPTKINAAGQIAGYGYVSDNSYQHASLWTPSAPNATTGSWVDLGVYGAGSGGVFSSANGLNDLGQVVGLTNMGMVNGQQIGDQAYLWTPTVPNGTTGTMVPLGTLGGWASEARGINNAQQIVGMSFWSADPAHENEIHAFLWTPNDGMIDLGAFGGTEAGATAISEDGKVVGWYYISNEYRAFLWTPDTPNGISGMMVDLGTLGGTEVGPTGVNSAGQVVGGSSLAGDATYRPFLWTAGTGMIDLGTLGGEHGYASGINEAGTIVGSSSVGSVSRPFVWTPSTPNGVSGSMTDMLTLGGSMAEGTAINSLNQITGWSSLDGDPPFADYGWGPIPISNAFVTAPSASLLTQTISFGELSGKTFGDADFGVSATATSGLTVSFGASGTCEVTGSTVHLTGAGTCTITASQAGNSSYSAATEVPREFAIAKGAQATVTIGAPPSLAYGSSVTLTSGGGSGAGAVTFSAGASTGCGVNGEQLSVTSVAGTCSVIATKAADDNYNAASSGSATVALNKATATLSLSNLTQAFTGTPRTVMVTTTPGSLNTVTVTYNGSSTAPTNVGAYAVVASLTNDNYQAANATGTLAITAALKSIALNPANVVGGNNVTGTVTLTAKAPAGGVSVPLSSSSTGIATVPATVTIPASANSATFTVTTSAVSAQASSLISVTWGVTKSVSLTVNPAALSSVALTPTAIVGGGTVAGTVTLNGAAPAGGAQVQLASSLAAATVPPAITVPEGQTSAPFTVSTTAVTAAAKPAITATYGSASKKATLTVNPAAPSTLTLNPTSVQGGTPSTGTVTLTGIAPAGGLVVTLASNRTAAATVPASVTIPAGASSTSFAITTAPVTATTSATITASVGRVKKTATLTVTQ